MKKGNRLTALGLALGLLAWTGTRAEAAYAPSDSLTVTITPNAVYQLDIDTTSVVLNLGVVNLAGSTFTVSPATVTVGSSFAATDLRIIAQITGGWTLDTNTASAENDALQAWAVFTDTGVSNATTVQGLAGAFGGTAPGVNGSDVLGITTQDVGTNGAVTQYVLNSGVANYKSMEDLPTNSVDAGGSQSHLWLKFTLPPTTTDTTAKNVTITVSAGAPN